MFLYGVQNGVCSDGVVLQKRVWVADASVHVGFSSKVHDRVHLADGFVKEWDVAYVAFYESVSRVVFHVM